MKVFVFLKWLRVAISLAFVLLISFLFLDFSGSLSAAFTNAVLYLQFVPSIIKFITLTGVSSIGFILILVFTLLFGRVYCSFFCPLGALQDIVIFGSGRASRKKTFKFIRSLNGLRYSFLAGTVILLAAGSYLALNLFDPYSLFGKIISNLFRPAWYGVNNVIVAVLEQFDVYTLYPVSLKGFSWISFGFSLFMLILVIRLSVKKGRLYCNSVCPAGTFLGFVARLSIFKIKLNKSSCTSCGRCSSVCKSGCIDSRNMEVDFSRCVGCFKCLTVCPGNGVHFKPSPLNGSRRFDRRTDNRRREFLVKSASTITGLVAFIKIDGSQSLKPGMKQIVRVNPVAPPGSQNITRFHKTCTACHLCISSCPTRVLQPSFTEYGWDGLFQPVMDYTSSFCNYECRICGGICPTGAILPLESEHKKRTQLGKAKFIKENCVVYTDETACGACSEHCPTKAVDMVPYKGRLTIPEVDDKICIGCGACEHSCPTKPKSIYVEGNPVHLLADKPKEKKPEPKHKPAGDFPF
jgi:ferredoxin